MKYKLGLSEATKTYPEDGILLNAYFANYGMWRDSR